MTAEGIERECDEGCPIPMACLPEGDPFGAISTTVFPLRQGLHGERTIREAQTV